MRKKNKLNQNSNEQTILKLKEAATLDTKSLINKYNSSFKGLKDKEQIKQNREEYGANLIAKKSRSQFVKTFIQAFFNPFSIILYVLSLISLIIDVIIPVVQKKYDELSYSTVVIIMTLVIISGIMQLIEETRSSASAEKLVKMIQTTTRVERNGVHYEIPLSDVVVGDIVILAAGDIIPADVRIINSTDLFVSQSSLTGESDSIEKLANLPVGKDFENVVDYDNLAFMGSNVILGSARAIVIVTGNNTYLGHVAQKINEKKTKTNFEKGLASISWLLIKIMLTVVPLVFLINGIKGEIIGNKALWVEGLIFAISVAVGLTPEMLPMIVTGALARGAVALSKKKTIVKSLNSIQNFGAINIFCTDKTGTLTLDHIVLERHLDIFGKENTNVLKYGFLNSYYQTGLKNLLDKSIIDKTDDLAIYHDQLRDLESLYYKIDEIPFDFERKRMSVIVKNKKTDSVELITKGALEEMLSISKYVEINQNLYELDETYAKMIMRKVDELNDLGMRVIGVARKENVPVDGKFNISHETDMILLGYLAFLDPPKESTASAIKKLHDLGVEVKILTGDNARVTKAICQKVGIPAEKMMIGKEVEELSDEQLADIIDDYNIFAKLSPDQKARLITVLRNKDNVVGYMGDGINDAPGMKAADVSISVDTAVDIAKESANIILLEKDLNVLADGIILGRKTYANMNKYIKMAVSSNFGNIFSIIFASILLPFIPMLAVQILFMNLIYSMVCIAIPFDKVDKEFLSKPRRWNAKSIMRFMFWFGPVSSIIDITSFLILYYWFIPNIQGIDLKQNPKLFTMVFQTCWFLISMWTQSLIIHFIRTEKIPFIQSRPSWMLLTFSLLGSIIVSSAPFIPKLNTSLNLYDSLSPWFILILVSTVVLYILLVSIVKWIYMKLYKELL
ncbi:magnesium-translocating P-type ATPase [Mycoplasmopsis opalescens]|uniref:magnesium-translocating P-type ATPase n=1 Tax=Mycoplasmopsis opalescens TaxID=114886 RepID=UPI000AEE7F0C|nr:magnesium-translocating P-type ATPase [Mycoplasmopsis opalescens]